MIENFNVQEVGISLPEWPLLSKEIRIIFPETERGKGTP